MKPVKLFILFFLFFNITLPLIASSGEINDPLLQLSSLNEDEIDIGRVCLLFSKEAYPELDVDKYSRKIDQMVNEIKKLTGKNKDPDHRIRALNTYLYQQQGFHYDYNDPYGRQLKNRYINGLLDSRSGSCFTMPLLYLALAQRLGYPIYPVSAPQHLFLRYVDPSLKMQNIEATGGGGYSSDEDYINDMEIPSRGIETGAYMTTMSYKELLAELFVENAVYWARKHSAPKAIPYFEVSLELNPNNAEVYRIYGDYQLELAKFHRVYQVSNNPLVRMSEERRQLEGRNSFISKGQELFRRAAELGAAPSIPKNYWLIQREKRKENKLSMETK